MHNEIPNEQDHAFCNSPFNPSDFFDRYQRKEDIVYGVDEDGRIVVVVAT